jgi:N-methylhydantoinase B/oxoprolinase/acetone carboxylase alpha subunit
MELHYPLLYLFRRHARDSSGAGKFRGGAGVESAHMLHDAPEKKLRGVAYGVASPRNSGHGIFGGYPGAPSLMVLLQKTTANEQLEKNQCSVDVAEIGGQPKTLGYCNFELRHDDVLYMRVASGGGYGDPLERDPQLVEKDVHKEDQTERAQRIKCAIHFVRIWKSSVMARERGFTVAGARILCVGREKIGNGRVRERLFRRLKPDLSWVT